MDEFEVIDELSLVEETPPEVDTRSEKEISLGISEDLQGCLKDILRICETEDESIYWGLVQKWTRLEYYFNNLIAIFWDASYAGGAGGWRVPDWNEIEEEGNLPPRIIGIYRAHAEAIIAALSVNVPSILFFPDDAEDPADIEASDAYSNIASLIQKHIKSPLLFMRVLTILFNQGTVFGYNYYKRSPQFGTKYRPTFESVEVQEFQNNCPICGNDFGQTPEPVIEPIICDVCQNQVIPEATEALSQLDVQSGVEAVDKGRVMIDIFDPRSVKVSIYAREQAHMGYLLLNFNQNVALIRAEFKDNKINAYSNADTLQWARNSTNYLGQFPDNVANVKCLWLRPWQFHALGDGKTEEINQLLALYPKGCYAIFINDEIKYIVDEDMDEHWTTSQNPLSSYVHGEPLGTNLAVVQDIQAEVDELRLQTMEHGIAETYVKPETLDLDLYRQSMARPGAVIPTKGAEPGRPLEDSFFQSRTAQMSGEIEVFNKDLQSKAQFTTGSFPSIYGGSLEGGGGTAFEYKKSNANALQRLSITWKIVSEFWCELITKSTTEFIGMMDGDENFTEQDGSGYKNVAIKQASLKGNISRAEPEFSDQLPITWEQINQVVTNLIMMNNPAIESVLFNPNNAGLMKKAIGLRDLYVPGEESRTKQYAEFLQLSQAAPIPSPDGMMMLPSVIPEELDNHVVEMEVLHNILTSPRGQKLKIENPEAYENCVLHWKFHRMMLPPPEEEEEQKSKSGDKEDAE